MDDRARARLTLSAACRDVAEFARSLVPTYADQHAEFGEYLTSARRLRLHAERVIDAAIAMEAARGATAEQIAAWLALPLATVELRLAAVRERAAVMDGDGVAADLDAWYAATGGPDAPPNAVSAGL